MKLCGIYLLTHTATGRKYVGQSRDIHGRWRCHSKYVSRRRLGLAIAKYGWLAFSAEVLELCQLEQLNEREMHWIALLDCISPKGFNLSSGGKQLGVFSSEARANMSASAKLKIITPEHRAKITAAARNRGPEGYAKAAISRTGLKRSPDAIAKTVAANLGRKHTPEAIAKITANHRNRSDETKAKIIAAARAREKTPELLAQVAAMSAGNVGRKLTPEHIAKTAAFHRGRKRSDETRARMREAQLAIATRKKNATHPPPLL